MGLPRYGGTGTEHRLREARRALAAPPGGPKKKPRPESRGFGREHRQRDQNWNVVENFTLVPGWVVMPVPETRPPATTIYPLLSSTLSTVSR